MYFPFAGDFQVALNLSRLKEALVSEGFVPVIVIVIIMFYHTTNTIKTKIKTIDRTRRPPKKRLHYGGGGGVF